MRSVLLFITQLLLSSKLGSCLVATPRIFVHRKYSLISTNRGERRRQGNLRFGPCTAASRSDHHLSPGNTRTWPRRPLRDYKTSILSTVQDVTYTPVEADAIDNFLKSIVKSRLHNVSPELRQSVKQCTDFCNHPELQLQPQVFCKGDFDYTTFVGKSEGELAKEIDEMFEYLDYSTPVYKGMLKAAGTGTSTICKMLRLACWRNDVLPVSVNLGRYSGLKLDPKYKRRVSNHAIEKQLYLACTITAGILFDRYLFSTFKEVICSMEDSLHHIQRLVDTSPCQLASWLVERALRMVRKEADGTRFEKVLVIADDPSAIWRMDECRSIYSVLTHGTILARHKKECEGITLFLTTPHLEHFQVRDIVPRLEMRSLTYSALDAAQIRDNWLKLPFANHDRKKATTRLLAALAPLPGLISTMKRYFQQLADDSAELTVADVYHSCRAEYMKTYFEKNLGVRLSDITFGTVAALISGRHADLSPNVLHLVEGSFILTTIIVRDSDNVYENYLRPESSVFILAQLSDHQLKWVKNQEAKKLLTALSAASNRILEVLLNTELSGSQYTRRLLTTVFAEWLDVRLQCVLICKNVGRLRCLFELSLGLRF
jgi:hypothetical protein